MFRIAKWISTWSREAIALLAAITITLGSSYVSGTPVEEEKSVQGSIRVDGSDLKSLAQIDAGEARDRVLAALREATVAEPELEVEDNYLVYEVHVVLGVQKLELELLVDAGNGKVLVVDNEAGDDEDDPDDDHQER